MNIYQPLLSSRALECDDSKESNNGAAVRPLPSDRILGDLLTGYNTARNGWHPISHRNNALSTSYALCSSKIAMPSRALPTACPSLRTYDDPFHMNQNLISQYVKRICPSAGATLSVAVRSEGIGEILIYFVPLFGNKKDEDTCSNRRFGC